MRQKVLIFGVLFILATLTTWSQDTIKVLAIGNSFSVDAVENYLYDLGQGEGITFIIGNLHIGGCSLERHWGNVRDKKSEYSYRKIDGTGKKTTTDVSLIQGITDEEWDYISFQQNSANSGLIETYFPYLTQLTASVSEHSSNPEVEFLFHQTWAYAKDSKHKQFPRYNRDQQQMYEAIMKASRQAAREAGIKRVIPSGTAIQNGRSSFIGDDFCRDGHHLSHGLGRYTAACTWFETLTGKSVVGNPFAPSTVNPLEAITVQRAAHEAVLEPFAVTKIRLEDNKQYTDSKKKSRN